MRLNLIQTYREHELVCHFLVRQICRVSDPYATRRSLLEATILRTERVSNCISFENVEYRILSETHLLQIVRRQRHGADPEGLKIGHRHQRHPHLRNDWEFSVSYGLRTPSDSLQRHI